MTDTAVTPSNDGGVNKPKPFSKEANYEIDEDFTMKIRWEKATEEIVFQVEMPVNSYLAVAFGSNLDQCDMIVFTTDEAKGPAMEDCFYEMDNPEYIDANQDWFTEVYDYGSRRNKLFTTRRSLDTGDDNDYAFQLDKQMVIGYQYSAATTLFEDHHFPNQSTLLVMSDGQTCTSWNSLFDMRRVPIYELHGMWMFFAWMPLGFLLLATKRYLKGNWKFWHWMHVFIGLLVLVITIW